MTTDRTRVRRLPEKASTDRRDLDTILDAAKVGHVAFAVAGQPFNLPVGVARDGDRLLMHGSTGSRLFRTLAAGTPACVAVTLLGGMVLARSAFESSMHYRSAMVFGTPSEVTDKLPALQAMSEQWLPGRWAELRPPNGKELAATMVLALPLGPGAEWSVKISDAPPEDDPADLDAPVWAGVLPILSRYGDPVPAPDLRGEPPVPGYLRTWSPG